MQHKIIALLAACTMIATGCSTPLTPESSPAPQSPNSDVTPPQSPNSAAASPQEVDRDTIYTVTIDNDVELSFDADGNVVEKPQDDGWWTLTDRITKAETYKTHTRTFDTGDRDEWGNPDIRTTTALHTLDGKLLYDYGDYTYGGGVGGLLVRKQHRGGWASMEDIPLDYQSALWNPKTGETVQPNIAEMSVLDKDKGTLAVFNVFGTLLGIMDSGGKIIKASDDTYYTNIIGGRIVSSNTEWGVDRSTYRYTMYDYDLNPIVTMEYIGCNTSWDSYKLFEYRDKGETGMMDSDGNKLFALPREQECYIDFLDGELMVISRRNGKSVLMKLDGTEVGEKYDQIEPICPDKYKLTEPPAQFIARSGETVSIIDRQGAVLRTATVTGLASISEATGKHIIYGADTRYSGLLDMELNVVIPADKYFSLHQPGRYIADGGYVSADLYVGQYDPRASINGQIDYSLRRLDIYNSDMEIIADSVTELGTVSTGRIALVRGFSAGVIDWQGNWVGKTSIFQIASDERKVDYY